MSSRWFTKEDAMKDLTTVTGKRITSLNKEFVVVGGRPPPPLRMHNKDSDIQTLRLYGGYRAHGGDVEQPDLQGITQMIRMVNDYHETFDKVPDVKPVTGGTMLISKLNPEVPEFIPKGVQDKTPNKIDQQMTNNQTPNKENVNAVCGNNTEIVNNIKNENVSVKTESRTSSNERINVALLNPEEKNEMKVKLKNKITSTSNATNFSVRKERNLAIASLVALHCRQPTEENTKILCTPEYFMNNKVSKDTNDLANTADDEKIKNKPIVDNDDCNSQISNNCDERAMAKTPQEMESIKKVQDWLNTEKPLKKDVYLGPITFKRKSKPESPNKNHETRFKMKHGNIFVPSIYASLLTRNYEDRCKAKVDDRSCDLWTKLEMDLKAKDEILKKQRVQSRPDPTDTL